MRKDDLVLNEAAALTIAGKISRDQYHTLHDTVMKRRSSEDFGPFDPTAPPDPPNCLCGAARTVFGGCSDGVPHAEWASRTDYGAKP
jgi:hypothetical protein